jgi:threonine dehydrogenase-like Zn-dependent dehydrogenase
MTEAAVFGRLSGLRLANVAETPLPGPAWASLRVLGCGICGSDLGNLSYESSPSMEPFGSFPATLGHEIVATVESVGSGVTRVAPGDRVAVDPMISCEVRGHSGDAVCPSCRVGRHGTCEMAGEEGALTVAGGRTLSPGLTIGYHRDLPGGWGDRMVAHESQLFPLDARVSSRAAVLMEPLSIGVHAVLNARPAVDDDVLVIGSGPIALGTIWALRASGFAGGIVAQTKRPHEAALARALGASEVIAPGIEAREALVATGAHAYQPIVGDEVFAGGGFAMVFDCVGSRSSMDQALRYASARGEVVLLGCAGELRRLDLSFLWSRELNVRGFVAYGIEDWRGAKRHTMEVTQELILESGAPVERLVTHVFPLSQYRDALSVAANHGRHEAVRVVLTPTEAGLP